MKDDFFSSNLFLFYMLIDLKGGGGNMIKSIFIEFNFSNLLIHKLQFIIDALS